MRIVSGWTGSGSCPFVGFCFNPLHYISTVFGIRFSDTQPRIVLSMIMLFQVNLQECVVFLVFLWCTYCMWVVRQLSLFVCLCFSMLFLPSFLHSFFLPSWHWSCTSALHLLVSRSKRSMEFSLHSYLKYGHHILSSFNFSSKITL